MLLTKNGLEKLQEEYQKLLTERPAAVLDLKKARDMGDLSENGYYNWRKRGKSKRKQDDEVLTERILRCVSAAWRQIW